MCAVEGRIATIGISAFTADQLGDIVFWNYRSRRRSGKRAFRSVKISLKPLNLYSSNLGTVI